MNSNKPTPRCIVIKMVKFKARENTKRNKRKRVIYKGIPIRLPVNFLQKLCRSVGNGMIYSRAEREKPVI